jgi:hypothetical protein
MVMEVREMPNPLLPAPKRYAILLMYTTTDSEFQVPPNASSIDEAFGGKVQEFVTQ